MCPEFVPGGVACRFVLVPGEVHHRWHDRTGQHFPVANRVDADLVENIYFVFIEHRDFPLVGLFVGTVVCPEFEHCPALVRHQKGRYFVESFTQETFEIEVSRVGSRPVEIRLCRFPEYRIVPDRPFYLMKSRDIGIDEQQQTPFFFLFLIGSESSDFDVLPVIGRDQCIVEKVVQTVTTPFQCVDAPFVYLFL